MEDELKTLFLQILTNQASIMLSLELLDPDPCKSFKVEELEFRDELHRDCMDTTLKRIDELSGDLSSEAKPKILRPN